LAGDLLDNRGRLKTFSTDISLDARLLEFCIKHIWKLEKPDFDEIARKQLIKEIMLEDSREEIDIEKVTVRFAALQILMDSLIDLATGNKEQYITELLDNIKSKLDQRSLLRKRLIIIMSISVVLILAWIANNWGVDLEKLFGIGIPISSVLFYLIPAIWNKEFNPKKLLLLFDEWNKQIVYKKYGFDERLYKKIYNKEIK